jgi:hypothetical protein
MNDDQLLRTLIGTDSPRDSDTFGPKAHSLLRLRRLGMRVPDAVLLSRHLFSQKSATDWTAIIQSHIQPLLVASGSFLAVRSSAASEDTAQESHAGKYLTEIDRFASGKAVMDAIKRVASSGSSHSGEVSVIVQAAVRARHSGVAFSCDPVTFDRSRSIVSYIEGMGTQLVSGRASSRTMLYESGTDNWRNLGDQPSGSSTILTDYLEAIRNGLQVLEEEYRLPVDTEWVIDTDGQLNWIQARPVVLPLAADIPLKDAEAFDSLPTIVRGHHKLRLRKWAAREGISMPLAVAHIRSSVQAPDTSVTSIAPDSAGTSVVLLYPTLVDGRVQREFSGTMGDYIDMIIASCQRYSVRRYPSFINVTEAVSAVIGRGLKWSWAAVAIDAKILNAELTGTISKIGDGFLVEIAQGHFVPKGIVETHQFALDDDLHIRYHRPAAQDFALHFVDGRVVHEKPVVDPIEITSSHAIAATEVLGPALRAGTYRAFEFGILDAADPASIYLIDTVESGVEMPLGSAAIEAGVISPGSARGKLFVIEGTGGDEVLDQHLH